MLTEHLAPSVTKIWVTMQKCISAHSTSARTKNTAVQWPGRGLKVNATRLHHALQRLQPRWVDANIALRMYPFFCPPWQQPTTSHTDSHFYQLPNIAAAYLVVIRILRHWTPQINVKHVAKNINSGLWLHPWGKHPVRCRPRFETFSKLTMYEHRNWEF